MKWIKIEERKPELTSSSEDIPGCKWSDYVLLASPDHDEAIKGFYEIDDEEGIEYWLDYELCEKVNATHWMPLPKLPYDEDKNKED
jgi:hypothetical protein